MIFKLFGARGKFGEARKAFAEAKNAGRIKPSEELRKGGKSEGSEWLTIRAKLVPAITTFIVVAIQLVDGFTEVDLFLYFTPETIDLISGAIIGAGFLWGGFDKLRSTPAAGVLPERKADSSPK